MNIFRKNLRQNWIKYTPKRTMQLAQTKKKIAPPPRLGKSCIRPCRYGPYGTTL